MKSGVDLSIESTFQFIGGLSTCSLRCNVKHFTLNPLDSMQGYVVVEDLFTREELQPARDDIIVLVEELAQKLYKAGMIKSESNVVRGINQTD